MAPSTEQIDDLLAWHPGPPEAARDTPLQALLWGARRATRAKLLLGWLWVAHVLLVQQGGAAILEAARTAGSWSEGIYSLVAAMAAASVFSDVTLGSGTTLFLEALGRTLWSPTPYFVVFYGLFAGGAIAYLHAPRSAPLLPQLGAASGALLGRFLRLLAIAAAVSWLLQYVGGLFFSAPAAGDVPWSRVYLWQGTAAVVAAIIDYTRVRTVARDSRSMLLESARSARFFVRNVARLLTLELALILLGVLLAAVAMAASEASSALLPPAASGLLTQQVFVIAFLWVRLAGWAAMLSMYQGITLRSLARRTDG